MSGMVPASASKDFVSSELKPARHEATLPPATLSMVEQRIETRELRRKPTAKQNHTPR
jgi:hypothetical protein